MSPSFSLIICTYMRPEAMLTLLDSVKKQSSYPNEIIIVDASTNELTKTAIANNSIQNLNYFLVNETHRGLTKQRNYGIDQVSESSTVVCFLDDDTVLEKDYFEKLLKTYEVFPEAIGVGGYIINEVKWQESNNHVGFNEMEFDGYKRSLGQRNVLRKRLGLLSNKTPGHMPEFSHGLSIGFLPPTGKTYDVEYFMGGVSSFKTSLFKTLQFSSYFDGYGLYEDLDFCLRASKVGDLYVNTSATLSHYHEESGRPNKFNYGKMVIRNGWYVWRVLNENPSIKAKIKWHTISLLLAFIRLSNVLTSSKRAEAFTESVGRLVGWITLIFNKPKISQ